MIRGRNKETKKYLTSVAVKPSYSHQSTVVVNDTAC